MRHLWFAIVIVTTAHLVSTREIASLATSSPGAKEHAELVTRENIPKLRIAKIMKNKENGPTDFVIVNGSFVNCKIEDCDGERIGTALLISLTGR